MRIIDLLRPYQADVQRIVDETPSRIDIRRYLLTAEGVEYVRSAPGGTDPLGPGTLALTALGPEPERQGRQADVASLLTRMDLGARAVVLFGWDPGEIPYHRLMDDLTAQRCQVLQVAAIDLATIGAAAVVERVDVVQPPRDALGEPVIPPPTTVEERFALDVRIANEHAFGAFEARILRATVMGSTQAAGQRRPDPYRSQLAEQLKERDTQVSRLKARIATMERSSSLRLGRALVGAARSPRALLRLPLDLYRIWRSRGS
jgi:hypothetical protein